jgi:hypothetical protein
MAAWMFRAPMGACGFAIAFGFLRLFVAMKSVRVGFSRAPNPQLIKQDYWSYDDLAVVRTFSAAGSLRLQRGIATKIHKNHFDGR